MATAASRLATARRPPLTSWTCTPGLLPALDCSLPPTLDCCSGEPPLPRPPASAPVGTELLTMWRGAGAPWGPRVGGVLATPLLEEAPGERLGSCRAAWECAWRGAAAPLLISRACEKTLTSQSSVRGHRAEATGRTSPELENINEQRQTVSPSLQDRGQVQASGACQCQKLRCGMRR